MSGVSHSARCIQGDGFYHEEDSAIGRQVDAHLANGYYFKTVAGLRFCRTRNFEDERVLDVIETLLPGSSLGFYKSYGAAERDLCVLNRTCEEPKVLLAQFWSSASRVIFYSRSHHHVLNATAAPTGLLQIPPSALSRDDIALKSVSMEHGGFSILDGRTGFRILEGEAVMFAFVAPDELIHWAKMELPDLLELQEEVKQIRAKDQTIGVNFTFLSRGSGTINTG